MAGYTRGRLFTAPAMRRLSRESNRIPRLVNILANKAMLSAYGKGKRLVGLDDVKNAAADTDSVARPNAGWVKWGLALVGLTVMATGAGVYLWINGWL